MTVGSLFSGIGGLDLGLERAGMDVIWQSEIDPYACAVLRKHWSEVPNLGDITAIDWSGVGRPDLVCGGFPCQDVSVAGKRAGIEGARTGLWREFLRCLREVGPRWALLENVPGLLSLGFGRVLGDLAENGFDAEWSVLSACAMGAPHTRERVFVVAYPTGHKHRLRLGEGEVRGENFAPSGWARWRSRTEPPRVLQAPLWGAPSGGIPGELDGLPGELDSPSQRCLGNAVVPQVAQWIGERIMAATRGF